MRIGNYDLAFNERGNLIKLVNTTDAHKMNWVIDPDYLADAGYHDDDKLFGEFSGVINGQSIISADITPAVEQTTDTTTVNYTINDNVDFKIMYQNVDGNVQVHYELANRTDATLDVSDFEVWIPFSYVMFRDKDVRKNIHNSSAFFASISNNYTKVANMRRDGENTNLGFYQTQGEVRSIGSYCDYTNLFFENVSPSLDGMLFNKIVFAGGYPEGNGPKNDWIYSEAGIEVPANSTKTWEFIMADFTDRDNFYEVGNQLGHPIVTADPMIKEGTDIHVNVQLPAGLEVAKMTVITSTDGELTTTDVTDNFSNGVAAFTNHVAGEHKVEVVFTDGTSDMLIYNVTKSLADVLNDRVEYISNELYQGADAEVPYSYKPLSNQGESLGKLSLVLQQNLLNVGHLNPEEVQKVELSVVNYVRPKWFIDGDFFNPRKLYGDFYRCMDFEYIGHVFYLLSKFDDSVLKLNSGKEYLSWAADVFDLRVNPDLHTDPRAKEESQMLGVFFLYINDLLADLKAGGLTDKYEIIKERWKQITAKIDKASDTYQAAITEHFYDNAGFVPASGARSMSGHKDAAKKYASLLRANIGYSNDFRAQAPDRWWEALSYMMHSLWGGITSAASQIAYDNLGGAELLKGAYRSTVAMLYLYDTEATATDRPLKKGEAASTFSIAGPNINRPDLSRNRFGQSAFAQDGGIFAKLFPEGDTGYADWDMGEEMVAYLNGFGQKTYVVGSGDDLEVINGRLEQVADDEYIVHSYAPYPTEYIFQDAGEDYHVAGSAYEDKVLLKGGKFTQYVGAELSK